MGNCTYCRKGLTQAQSWLHDSKSTEIMDVKLICTTEAEESKLGDSSFNLHNRKTKIRNPQKLNTHHDIAEAANAVISEKAKNLEEKEKIRTVLNSIFIFNSLSVENIEEIITKLKYFEIEPSQLVYAQGCSGSHFFIVADGKLEILVNGEFKGFLNKGDAFGEAALIQETPRSHSVFTVTKTNLWGISRADFRTIVEFMSAQKYMENKSFVDSVPLFQILTPAQKDGLLAVISIQNFEPGIKIVTQGEEGDLFYIIKDGTVSCVVDGKVIRHMSRGDYFGEQALLYNSKRTATIISLSRVSVLNIKRDDLANVLGNQLELIIYKNSQRIAIENSHYLKVLTKSQIELMINHTCYRGYKNREVVIPRGTQKGEKLLIIVKGSLITSKTGKTIPCLSCIGDQELLLPPLGIYEESYIANGPVDIEEITREYFEGCIGGQLNKISSQNEVLNIMKKTQLFRALPNKKLEQMVNALYIQNYGDKEVIFYENSCGDAFYIVKEGQVDIVKDNATLRTITNNDYFGERSILGKEKRTANAIANGPVQVWVLSKEDFLLIIDEGIRGQLIKRMYLQDNTILLTDLVPVKLLGKGTFGNVFLTVHKKSQIPYALKTVSRAKIRAYEIYNNLLLERNILLQIDHPFIMKLVKTFKDRDRIYYLTEFVRGNDLFDVINELKKMNDKNARFYAACLMIILEHLHERNIIYRDLKPENIMIDEDGYPKLIDFGTAKIVDGRTYSIVGTPHYMAPEVIKGGGYGLQVDLWCLGVIIYEITCGSMPFGEEEDEPFTIYEKILKNKLSFPPFIDYKAKSKFIIEKLLNKNPALRGEIDWLKTHIWFEGLNWDRLLGKQETAPYIPKLHSLSFEIARAFKINSQLYKMIAKEELIDSHDIPKFGKRSPSGWDDAF